MEKKVEQIGQTILIPFAAARVSPFHSHGKHFFFVLSLLPFLLHLSLLVLDDERVELASAKNVNKMLETSRPNEGQRPDPMEILRPIRRRGGVRRRILTGDEKWRIKGGGRINARRINGG